MPNFLKSGGDPRRRTRARVAASISTLVLGAALGFAVTGPAAAASGPAQAGPHLLKPHKTGAAPFAVIPGPLINHGGPVQSAPRVYVDFWGWTSDPSGEQPYLDRFLSSVGGTPWLATVNQYGGGSNGNLLAGTWSNPAAVPASPSDAQIQAEAASAAAHFGTGTSVNVQIVVATPTGHSTPGFGSSYCAYHGAVASTPNVTYTDLPYLTDAGTNCGEGTVNGGGGTLDGVSIVEGHELAEAITDPLLNAWIDAGKNEIGDKCAWTGLSNLHTTAGTFAVQPLWSNAANGCVNSSGGGQAPYQVAFQANTTSLWTVGADNHDAWILGMASNTSPAVANLSNGGYEVAFQANTTSLWTVGADNHGAWNLGMAAGTSPSIAALAGGGYEVAFQANTGDLWTVGTAGTTDWHLGMAAGTSPSITALTNGSYEVAFQANTTSLWTVGSDNHGAWNLGMAGNTSPSIAGLANGSYEVAFQANTTSLWTVGSDNHDAWNLGMAGNTSPAITN
ncbi:MAG TPA: hypothetical protein VFU74_19525 [Actinocrinis sp.]|nr:hypothetical protein [Actinocrinis sp.]